MRDLPAGNRYRDSLSIKLCLAGDQGVGKTSTVRRFVTNTFDDAYLHTLGAKVSTRTFDLPDPLDPARAIRVAASIWDVMGSHGFRETLKDAYFYNTQGVLLVADGARLETLRNLGEWSDSVTSIAGDIPILVLANKADLPADARIPEDAIEETCGLHGWPWMWTSAKTGESVAHAFAFLTDLYLRSARGDRTVLPPPPAP